MNGTATLISAAPSRMYEILLIVTFPSATLTPSPRSTRQAAPRPLLAGRSLRPAHCTTCQPQVKPPPSRIETSVGLARVRLRWSECVYVPVLTAGDHRFRDHGKVGGDGASGHMRPERASVFSVHRGQCRSAADIHPVTSKRDRRPDGISKRATPPRLAGRGFDVANGLIVAPEKDNAIRHGR